MENTSTLHNSTSTPSQRTTMTHRSRPRRQLRPREEDFLSLCRKVALEIPPEECTLENVMERVTQMPPRTYHITFEYALRMWRRFSRYPRELQTHQKKPFWTEFMQKVTAVMQKHPQWDDRDAVWHVLNNDHPSTFGMNPNTALAYYYHARSRRR